jgi:two-component system OmpR family sensor kinase
MTLGRRLSIAFTAVTAVVLALSFASVFLLVRKDELYDLDRAISRQAHTTAQSIESEGDVALEGFAFVPEHYDPLPRYAAIYDGAGAVIATTKSFGSEAPTLAQLGVVKVRTADEPVVTLKVRDDELRGVVLALSGSRALLYAASRREVTVDERFLIPVLATLFVLGISATALVAQLLVRRFVRDIHTLARVARAVSGGHLDARVGLRTRGSSEMRNLATDVDSMIDRLSELVVAQGTFVSHAAHELRSPLATLRGELQLALRRPRQNDEYKKTLETALAEVEGLTRLAEDLLTLARVQGSDPESGVVGVDEILKEAVHMASGRAGDRDVAIEARDETRGALVRGAPRDLARALRNLVDNAITHSPASGVVEVIAERGEEGVAISVVDHGQGVHQGDAAQVFSPFFRGPDAGQRDALGSGLGLAIARGIARSHGGDVLLANDPNRTCFVLKLAPAKIEDRADLTA